MLRKRERLLKRQAKVEAALTVIEKAGAVIKKHCAATPDEIQAAIRAHKAALHDAEVLALGAEFAALGAKSTALEAKAKLRRLAICREPDTAWLKAYSKNLEEFLGTADHPCSGTTLPAGLTMRSIKTASRSRASAISSAYECR